jgi:predicted RNA binding protein YcfA (HicA-like mRNA interferase family)
MPIRLSGKEIVRALSKDGWELERIRGSHHIMRHPDGRQVTVPVHGSQPGLERSASPSALVRLS